jgi:hypothetical protein
MEPSYYPIENKPYKVLGEEEVLTSNFNLLWIFSVTNPPDIGLAVTEAVNRKGGDAMIDLRIWRETQLWIVGTVQVLHIRGKIIKYIDNALVPGKEKKQKK